jgi:Trk-type K+ transport system membrane component
MSVISSGGFAVLWILMFVGSTTFMTVPTMLWRRNRLGRTLGRMNSILLHYNVSYIDPDSTANPFDNPEPIECVKHHRQLYDALFVAVVLVMSYMMAVCVIGVWFLFLALKQYAEEPELRLRGFSHLHNAIFLGFSAYTNTGATISSSNMEWHWDKPGVLVVMGALILLGNVLFPYMMHLWIEAVTAINQKWSHSRQQQLNSSLQFIRRHPRVVCTYFFCYGDVVYLLHMSLLCIILEWAVFMMTCVYRGRDSFKVYGSNVSYLALMGLFQTLNSRHAGRFGN